MVSAKCCGMVKPLFRNVCGNDAHRKGVTQDLHNQMAQPPYPDDQCAVRWAKTVRCALNDMIGGQPGIRQRGNLVRVYIVQFHQQPG